MEDESDGGKTTRAIVWCQFWTFRAVWGTFALGPEHRLDHPHVGWTMVDEFLGPVPDCGMMSHWGQNPLRCDGSVRSLRGDGCCPLARTFPEGGEKNLRRWLRGALHMEDALPRLWIFPGPSVIIGAHHHMWSGDHVPRWTWTLLDAAWYYAFDGGLSTRVRPPWPRSGPGRVEPPLGPPEDDGGLE